MSEKPGAAGPITPSETTGATQQPSRHGIAWLGSFRSRLVDADAQAFVAWAADTAGPGIVLDRSRFGPEDLKPWLGNIFILQWDPEAGDYRYRVFGSNWPFTLGADLTGRHLSAWPRTIAVAKRERLHAVLARRIPAAGHFRGLHELGGNARTGHETLEQVVWPLRYSTGAVDAVLDLTVRLPNEAAARLTLPAALAEPHGDWFSADDEVQAGGGSP